MERTVWSRALRSTKRYFEDISIEPILFLFSIGFGIKYGAGVVDQLLLDKVCRFELNQPKEVCDNLTAHETIEEEVQSVANTFSLYRELVKSLTGSIASMFMGAFAERFGFKACMFLAIIGILLTDVQDYLNYAFFEELPLEFLYMEPIVQSLFAGFYVGAYGLVSNFAKPSEKAFRFARMDSVSVVSSIIAVSLSAKLFSLLSYYGVYAINTASACLSILYLVFVAKETPDGRKRKLSDTAAADPDPKPETDQPKGGGVRGILREGLIQPGIDLYKTVLKPRANNRRFLLIVMLVNMLIYYATLSDILMMYPFMKLKYDVSYEEFSLFNTVCGLIHLFALAGLMPLMIYVLEMHETLILAIVAIVGATSLTLSAFANTVIPGMMITYGLSYLRFCCFPNGRSLLTKMVEPDEVGKIYAVLSLLVTATAMGASAIYRILYDATLDSFPSAYLLLSAGLYFTSGVISLALFTQRRNLYDRTAGKKKEDPDGAQIKNRRVKESTKL